MKHSLFDVNLEWLIRKISDYLLVLIVFHLALKALLQRFADCAAQPG